MASIVEFLEARIAEDVARVVDAKDWVANGPSPHIPWYGAPGDRAEKALGGAHALVSAMSPARVLAECAAKRTIITLAGHVESMDYQIMNEWGGDIDGTGDDLLKSLAAVYADHPDYRQSWAPRG